MNFQELYSLKSFCTGTGMNHEAQTFIGQIHIEPVVSGRGLKITFKATGYKGEVFHEEDSFIGPGFDGRPCLYVLSNNHPSVTPHHLVGEEKGENGIKYTFAFGKREDVDSFREEIVLFRGNDGSVEYSYSWGMPGGEFKARSAAKMLMQ